MHCTRNDVFGGKHSHRALDEFLRPCPAVEWLVENPMLDIPAGELTEMLHAERKWRHHHGIESLRETPEFYAAYSLRVDAMLEPLDDVMTEHNIDPSSTTFVDIAAAEG